MKKNIGKTITIDVLRLIDDYLGLIFCALFTGIKGLLPSKKQSGYPERILVMKFWEGGCIILLYPYLKELKRKYSKAKITLFTLSDNKEICYLLNVADEVVAVDYKTGVFNFVIQMLKQVIRFRREKQNLLIDLEFLSRSSAMLSYIIAPKTSVGFYSPFRWRGRIHDSSVLFDDKIHVMENFKNAFLSAGVNINEDEEQQQLSVDKEDLKAGKIIEGKYIVINLDRKGFINQRCWPVENCEAVIKYLIDNTDYKIAGISSYGFEEINSNFGPRFVNLMGKLSFMQLAELLRNASFFITHDSGPMHLAAALGTPTVSLFGPETPAAYGPKGENHLVFYKALECSPCVDVFKNKQVKCKHSTNKCMQGITVNEVITGIQGRYLAS